MKRLTSDEEIKLQTAQKNKEIAERGIKRVKLKYPEIELSPELADPLGIR